MEIIQKLQGGGVMKFWETYQKLCLDSGKRPNPVGKELGISTGSIAQWKNGSIPSGETLIKIADYFNVSIDYLLGREESPVRVNGHVNGDNSVQSITDSPVTTIQEPPKQIIADGLTSEFMEAFQGLSFPDKMEVMNLTMQKMQKGA